MSKQAKELHLDVPRYASVEFPLNVRDIDRAMEMVGGESAISQSLLGSRKLELKLRPGDPFQHPIQSTCLDSDNILLEVKVPKRILQKHNNLADALAECERLKAKHKVSVAAVLNKSFRFRELADFQMLTKNSKFSTSFESSLLNGDLEEIKKFSSGLDYYTKPYENGNIDLPPPPRFARTNVPFNYQYTGNPVTLLRNEHGEIYVQSRTQRARLYTTFINWDDPTPTECNEELKKQKKAAEEEVSGLLASDNERLLQSSNNHFLLEAIKLLEGLFTLKPVWLRRHIYWIFPKHLRGVLKSSLPFVAYSFRKGPWRQSFIKFGYDPRSDPNALGYQVESFRIQNMSTESVMLDPDVHLEESELTVPATLYSTGRKLPRQFVFDGHTVPGMTSFHLGDITDPDIRAIIEVGKKGTCTEDSGWLTWSAINKLQGVMRYKINCLFKDEPILAEKLEKIKEKEVNPVEGEEDDDDEEDEDEEDEDAPLVDPQVKHDVFTRLRLYNPEAYEKLSELSGFLKQEDVMNLPVLETVDAATFE